MSTSYRDDPFESYTHTPWEAFASDDIPPSEFLKHMQCNYSGGFLTDKFRDLAQ